MKSIEVQEYPVPAQWVAGTLNEHGGVPIIIKRRAAAAYIVTLSGNVMDAENGIFKHWQEMIAADVFPTLHAAFEAFKKFYG